MPSTPRHECDMIMKGGITSGVVYPGAVAELSKTHRFRRVGGASAGAIAAAGAAACELGRQSDPEAFSALGDLPTDLGRNMQQRLQPSDELSPLWDMAMAELERAGERKRVASGSGGGEASRGRRLGLGLRILRLAISQHWERFAVPIVVGVAVTAIVGIVSAGWAWAFGILLTLCLAVVGAVWSATRFAARTIENLDTNGFGFCNGQTSVSGASVAPLTEWLTGLFSEWAGLPDGEILTFAHLWGTEATATYLDSLDREEHNPPPRSAVDARVIDLQMMVTNLSMRRPHKFPFDVRTFFWCEECLGTYFNADVIGHMRTHSEPLEDRHDGVWKMTCADHPETQLRYLPPAPHQPVVLGVRMSLSFPVLFSAVPLHTIDWSRTSDAGRGPHKIWFADGGMTSNFPMHFFDAMWPTRPTFGITLAPENPDYPGQMVFRPTHARSGMKLPVASVSGVFEAAAAMVRTMQNWADNTLAQLPGYRDRIVEIRTKDHEGGLNLAMPPEVITGLSDRGVTAAESLVEFNMDEHRWIRYRVAMSELDELVGELAKKWMDVDVEGTPLPQMLTEEFDHPKYRPSSDQWIGRDREATEELIGLADSWRSKSNPASDDPPRPKPHLRLTPRM